MTKPTVPIEIAHLRMPGEQSGMRATMGGCRRRREQRSLKWPAHYISFFSPLALFIHPIAQRARGQAVEALNQARGLQE